MKIHLRKTSLIDYPGCISSVLFFSGCNLRCPWCHNRELIVGGNNSPTSITDSTNDSTTDGSTDNINDSIAHLHKRKSVLGGVVLSGGEPCLWDSLPDIISEIKRIPLPVKLDTNGLFPSMLEKLFNRQETRPDFIALDLKIAPERYGELCKDKEIERADKIAAQAAQKLIQSADLIRRSGIPHEYRSLALPGAFVSERDIEALAPLADEAPWYFRLFKGGNCLDPAWNSMEEPLREASARAEALAKKARYLGKNGIAK